MKQSALHISTQVLTGNKIEIETPDLPVGEIVEVFIITTKSQNNKEDNSSDPLIGLFQGSADLATKSEEILEEEIQEHSGWTWKEK